MGVHPIICPKKVCFCISSGLLVNSALKWDQFNCGIGPGGTGGTTGCAGGTAGCAGGAGGPQEV